MTERLSVVGGEVVDQMCWIALGCVRNVVQSYVWTMMRCGVTSVTVRTSPGAKIFPSGHVGRGLRLVTSSVQITSSPFLNIPPPCFRMERYYQKTQVLSSVLDIREVLNLDLIGKIVYAPAER
jgi:hypothetical protein